MTLASIATGLLGQTVPSTPTTTTPAPGCNGGLCTASGSLHISVAYRSIIPILVMSVGALVLLAVSAILPKRSRPGLYPALTTVIALVSTATAVWQWNDLGTKGRAEVTIGGQVIYDRFSVLFMILVSVATVIGAMSADSYLRREGLDGVEAYVLMLMAATGAMLMAVSGGLIMLFLGLEIMSIALYVMAAYHRRRTQSGEAGLKYFILGSFSSALFLYGIALTYGATGSLNFQPIANFLATNTLANSGVLLAGMALLIVGLGFKVAAVPFHFWTPDVYQGSPTPFTGYMAAVAKAAGFAGLIRVLSALTTEQSNWRPILWLIAVLTLVIGSLLAIAQKDLKRMLAYSSISQAGYVLVGVQAASSTGNEGALFYLFTYTFIIIGSFVVVTVIQGSGETRNDLGAIRGLAKRKPYLAAAMLVFLLAQAGVPFTSGFLAKFYVVQASVEAGQYALAIIAMLAAAIAAFFYLRVALLMYSTPGPAAASTTAPAPAPASETGPVSAPVPSVEWVPVGARAGIRKSPAHREEAVALTPAELSVAGLEPVPTIDDSPAPATFESPSRTAIHVPFADAAVLAICVVFTVAAGVSSFAVDFAHSASLLF